MAQRTVTILTDDLDGTESKDVETIRFGFDGATYEIDLTKKNRDALEKALTPYLNASRKAGKANTGSAGRSKASSRDYDPKAVRAWATAKKMDVPARGRIPAGVVDAFKKAGN